MNPVRHYNTLTHANAIIIFIISWMYNLSATQFNKEKDS